MDATPEIIEAAAEWFLINVAQPLVIAQDSERMATPEIGDTVESVTKRGKNVGLRGTVRWVRIVPGYRRWDAPKLRLGVKIDSEPKLRFIDAASVKIIETNRKPLSDKEIKRSAELMTGRAAPYFRTY